MSVAATGTSVASLPTGSLPDALAETGPGPAGGSAAALATAMASGLVRLVARVSYDWDEAPGIAAQAAALGDRSLVLADEDHIAYAHALEQLRAPDRDAALGMALRRAAEVPLRIAEVAADVAALAALAARDGADAVRGDAWAADDRSVRADAAARAAETAREGALSTT